MELRPLAMGEQIAHLLRLEIITGVIADNTHLAEDALAARFDVSRGPIRDALRQLESEGLLEARRKRLYSRTLGIEGVEELYDLREALEGLAIRRAIANASNSDWNLVQGHVDRMRLAADTGDLDMFADADMAFHNAFYTFSGNRRLYEAWRPYQRTFAILFEMSGTSDIEAATRDHQGFLDIVRTGDADASVKRLHLHLTLAKGHVRDVLRRVNPTAEED